MNERFARGFNKFVVITPCATCVRRNMENTLICEAFPMGIPEVIFRGDNLHIEPFPGDHGLKYKAREEMNLRWL